MIREQHRRRTLGVARLVHCPFIQSIRHTKLRKAHARSHTLTHTHTHTHTLSLSLSLCVCVCVCVIGFVHMCMYLMGQ